MKNITIVGGTHGNELTGIKLIQKWRDNREIVARDHLTVNLEYGNPPAIKAKVRFIDEDLNRAFHIKDLEAEPTKSWESRRAHEINELLGPKFNNPKAEVIIDLHTTTSNMGNTIIVYNDPLNLKMAKYIQTLEPNVRVYISDKDIKDTIGLHSLATYGMLLEVGPIPQGVLYHKQFEDMERITHHALDFMNRYDEDPDFDVTGTLEVYQRGTLVPYPTNESGDMSAMLHKNVQNKDYCLLNQGDPIFMTFNGETICYDGEPGFPVFINEAAYYETNMAFRMNTKMTLSLAPRNRN
ncbi:MAG: aspartoacylase [Phycisphaeraceae bacterium]|nr:aspartoacylase [Phycisphaeraceae bacterium]